MKLLKHQRLTLTEVRKLHKGLDAHIHPGRKHPKLVVRYAGHVIHMSVASSPTCADDVIRRTVRDVRVRLRAIGA